MSGLTWQQSVMVGLLDDNAARGFTCEELAAELGTSPQGAARTAASLVRRGLAVRFTGGVGTLRVHYRAVER